MLASDMVKPFRVAESPVQFECKVNEIVALGTEGGAGNLVICEVIKIHINEAVLDENGGIDQHKIDLVARMGGNWYTRANIVITSYSIHYTKLYDTTRCSPGPKPGRAGP